MLALSTSSLHCPQIRCLHCNGESNKRDAIMDVCLDVHRLTSVREALLRFTHPEVLDGDNKYRCERCGRLSDAHKALSIFHAPNVLVLQLKVSHQMQDGWVPCSTHFTMSIFQWKASTSPMCWCCRSR